MVVSVEGGMSALRAVQSTVVSYRHFVAWYESFAGTVSTIRSLIWSGSFKTTSTVLSLLKIQASD